MRKCLCHAAGISKAKKNTGAANSNANFFQNAH